MNPERCRAVHATLATAYGPQGWWPAQTPFEVMVGAVLTQNAAWTNVELALKRLTGRIPLTAEAILALEEAALADALRPSGYFNIKARRLLSFCRGFLAGGGLAGLGALDTPQLRRHLLDIPGVGLETADDILLYAFARPVFVVDAYTRRIFARLGLLRGDEGYETIRAAFETALGAQVPLFNDYHALIVRHGKEVCRTHPRCDACCLSAGCPTAPIPRPR